MISIQKNSTNLVVLELTPTAPPGETYFIFELIWESDTTNYKRYFTTLNLSLAKDRYDCFIWTEDDFGSQDQIVDNEAIFLNPGQYRVNVYSTFLPPDPNNLWPYIIEPIQTHRMVVFGSSLEVDPVYDSTFVNPYQPSVYD